MFSIGTNLYAHGLQEAVVIEAQPAGTKYLSRHENPPRVLHAHTARISDPPRRPTLIPCQSDKQTSWLAELTHVCRLHSMRRRRGELDAPQAEAGHRRA